MNHPLKCSTTSPKTESQTVIGSAEMRAHQLEGAAVSPNTNSVTNLIFRKHAPMIADDLGYRHSATFCVNDLQPQPLGIVANVSYP